MIDATTESNETVTSCPSSVTADGYKLRAMTGAERQKRYRDKKAGKPLPPIPPRRPNFYKLSAAQMGKSERTIRRYAEMGEAFLERGERIQKRLGPKAWFIEVMRSATDEEQRALLNFLPELRSSKAKAFIVF